MSCGMHTEAKKPQTLDPKSIKAEMKKNGRFPQMFAPDAVKNVVNPVQNTRKPMIKLEAISKLTLYFSAISGKAGVTIGPRLIKSASDTDSVLIVLRGRHT
jgi:hypothetical protein